MWCGRDHPFKVKGFVNNDVNISESRSDDNDGADKSSDLFVDYVVERCSDDDSVEEGDNENDSPSDQGDLEPVSDEDDEEDEKEDHEFMLTTDLDLYSSAGGGDGGATSTSLATTKLGLKSLVSGLTDRARDAWSSAKQSLYHRAAQARRKHLHAITPRLYGCWLPPPPPTVAAQAAATSSSAFSSVFAKTSAAGREEQHLVWRSNRQKTLDQLKALMDRRANAINGTVTVYVAGSLADLGLEPSDFRHQVFELADGFGSHPSSSSIESPRSFPSPSQQHRQHRPPPVETLAGYAELVCQWVQKKNESVAVILSADGSWAAEALLAACLLYARFVVSSQLALELVSSATGVDCELSMPPSWRRTLHWLARSWLHGNAPPIQALSLASVIVHGIPKVRGSAHFRPLVDVRDGNGHLLTSNAVDASTETAAALDVYPVSESGAMSLKLKPTKAPLKADIHIRLSHVTLQPSTDPQTDGGSRTDMDDDHAPLVQPVVGLSVHTSFLPTVVATQALTDGSRIVRYSLADLDVLLPVQQPDATAYDDDSVSLRAQSQQQQENHVPDSMVVDLLFVATDSKKPSLLPSTMTTVPLVDRRAGDQLLFGRDAETLANGARDSLSKRLRRRLRSHSRQVAHARSQHLRHVQAAALQKIGAIPAARAEASLLARARAAQHTALQFYKLFGRSAGDGAVDAHHALLLVHGDDCGHYGAGDRRHHGAAVAAAAAAVTPLPGTLYVSSRYIAFASSIGHIGGPSVAAGARPAKGGGLSAAPSAVAATLAVENRRFIIPWGRVRELTPLSGAAAPRLCARALYVDVDLFDVTAAGDGAPSSSAFTTLSNVVAAPGAYVFGWIEPRARGLAAATRAWSAFSATRAAAVAASSSSPPSSALSSTAGPTNTYFARRQRDVFGPSSFTVTGLPTSSASAGEAAEGALPLREWQALQLGAKTPQTLARGHLLLPEQTLSVYRVVDGVVSELAESDLAPPVETRGADDGLPAAEPTAKRKLGGRLLRKSSTTNSPSGRQPVHGNAPSWAMTAAAAATVVGPGELVGVTEFFLLDDYQNRNQHRGGADSRAVRTEGDLSTVSGDNDRIRQWQLCARTSAPDTRVSAIPFQYLRSLVSAGAGMAAGGGGRGARDHHRTSCRLTWFLAGVVARQVNSANVAAAESASVIMQRDPTAFQRFHVLGNAVCGGNVLPDPLPFSSPSSSAAVGVAVTHSCCWTRFGSCGAGGDGAFHTGGDGGGGGGGVDRLVGELRCGASTLEFRARVFGFDVRRVVRLGDLIRLSRQGDVIVMVVADGGVGDAVDVDEARALAADMNRGLTVDSPLLVQLVFTELQGASVFVDSLRRAVVAAARLRGQEPPVGVVHAGSLDGSAAASVSSTAPSQSGWDGLSERDWRLVMAEARVLRRSPGQSVVGLVDGTASPSVYRVVSGTVAVLACLSAGPRILVELLQIGDTFGHSSLFADHPIAQKSHSSTGHDDPVDFVAVAPGTVVHAIPAAWLRALTAVDPSLGRRIGRWTGRRLACRAQSLRQLCAQLGQQALAMTTGAVSPKRLTRKQKHGWERASLLLRAAALAKATPKNSVDVDTDECSAPVGATSTSAGVVADDENEADAIDGEADSTREPVDRRGPHQPTAVVMDSFPCSWERPSGLVPGFFYVVGSDAAAEKGSAGFLSKATGTKRLGSVATVAIDCVHVRCVGLASNDSAVGTFEVRGGRLLSFVFGSPTVAAAALDCVLKFCPWLKAPLPTLRQLDSVVLYNDRHQQHISGVDDGISVAMTNGSDDNDTDNQFSNVTVPVLTALEWTLLSSGIRTTQASVDGHLNGLQQSDCERSIGCVGRGAVGLGVHGLEQAAQGELFMEHALFQQMQSATKISSGASSTSGPTSTGNTKTSMDDNERFASVRQLVTKSIVYVCEAGVLVDLLRQSPRLLPSFCLWTLHGVCVRRARFIRNLVLTLSVGWAPPGVRPTRWSGTVYRQVATTGSRWKRRTATVTANGYLTLAKSTSALADPTACECIYLLNYTLLSAADENDESGEEPGQSRAAKDTAAATAECEDRPFQLTISCSKGSGPPLLTLATDDQPSFDRLRSVLRHILQTMGSARQQRQAAAVDGMLQRQRELEQQLIKPRKKDVAFCDRFRLPPDQRMLHEMRCQCTMRQTGTGTGKKAKIASAKGTTTTAGLLQVSSDYCVFVKPGHSSAAAVFCLALADLDSGPVLDAGSGTVSLADGAIELSSFPSREEVGLIHDVLSSFWALCADQKKATAKQLQLLTRFDPLLTAVDARSRTLGARFAVTRAGRPLTCLYVLRTGSVRVVGRLANGSPFPLCTLTAGAVFGEDCVVSRVMERGGLALADERGTEPEVNRLDHDKKRRHRGPGNVDDGDGENGDDATDLLFEEDRTGATVQPAVSLADYVCDGDGTIVQELQANLVELALARDHGIAIEFLQFLALRVSQDVVQLRKAFSSIC